MPYLGEINNGLICRKAVLGAFQLIVLFAHFDGFKNK